VDTDKNKSKAFADRVLMCRNGLRLSQLQIAKKIGSSHGSIQNYESGSFPKGEFAIKLAEVFECSIDWLLAGKGDAPIYKDGKRVCPPESDQKTSPPNNITQVVIEHQDVVREFLNSDKAMEFNQFLVEIEKHDPEGYDELYREARAIYKTLKRIQQKEVLKKNSDKKDLQNGTTA
jgi:transcriptional regulator with XRE-family HTH domain